MAAFPLQAKVNADIKADLTPLSQAAANLADSPRKGVGKIFHAFVGPWVANRERNIALLQAQTEKDCADIKNGVKIYREGRLLGYPNPEGSVDPYDVLHALNHKSDARRLQAAVEEAARQIYDVPPADISDAPISQTFFNRWRREAEMIDEDVLRQFWARLLVEETKKPNSISPGTLEVARNLTSADAALFQKLCRGVVDSALIIDANEKPIHGTYEDVLTLQDAGLLNSQGSLLKTTSSSEHGSIFFNTERLAICSKPKPLQSACHKLTRAGMEIMKTIYVKRSEDDVIAMAKIMASHVPQSLIFVFRTEEVPRQDGTIQYQVNTDKLIWTSAGMR
ncbi:MAG: DUF2806 domain-containing protein [Kiritimatiellae bacterium]|nr:DUF2806 domain-containing protein [Kiritimatiellia bacterium]